MTLPETTPPKPLHDISSKVVDIADLAVHRKYRKVLLQMIQQLLDFIKEEQDKLSPKESAEDVASHLISEFLDPEIPHSRLLGMALMRYAGSYFYSRNR